MVPPVGVIFTVSPFITAAETLDGEPTYTPAVPEDSMVEIVPAVVPHKTTVPGVPWETVENKVIVPPIGAGPPNTLTTEVP